MAILVYSVDDLDSLHSLIHWLRDVEECCPDATKVVLGNKMDLHSEVPLDKEEQFTGGNDCKSFVRVSAKTGQGVSKVFQAIAQMLVDAASSRQVEAQPSTFEGGFSLEAPRPTDRQQKKGCCS